MRPFYPILAPPPDPKNGAAEPLPCRLGLERKNYGGAEKRGLFSG